MARNPLLELIVSTAKFKLETSLDLLGTATYVYMPTDKYTHAYEIKYIHGQMSHDKQVLIIHPFVTLNIASNRKLRKEAFCTRNRSFFPLPAFELQFSLAIINR